MDSLNRFTGTQIRVFAIVSLPIIIIGIIIGDEKLLHLGVLTLIFTPLVGVIVSFVSLTFQKDYRWALITLSLIGLFAVEILIYYL